MKRFSGKHGKPVLFTEAGYRSIKGASLKPWVSANRGEEVQVSEEEQMYCYEALSRVFWNEPWFAGIHWWKYYSVPPASSSGRRRAFMAGDYTPQGKLAEGILKKWYGLRE